MQLAWIASGLCHSVSMRANMALLYHGLWDVGFHKGNSPLVL